MIEQLRRLFRKSSDQSSGPEIAEEAIPQGLTSGEVVLKVAGGSNLVGGKQTWELAESGKDDLETMKQCCVAEEATFRKTGLVPAPYYFERVAILSRKARDYQQEIEYCERYIRLVDEYYEQEDADPDWGVTQGPRYGAIAKRLPKARLLLAKQKEDD